MSYYVESDGDRVPKDVYVCDGAERVLTMECASEDRRFRLARRIVTALNSDAVAPALLAALKGLFDYIEAGVLVRDITHDLEPDWPLKQLRLVAALKAAQTAIAQAEGTPPSR